MPLRSSCKHGVQHLLYRSVDDLFVEVEVFVAQLSQILIHPDSSDRAGGSSGAIQLSGIVSKPRFPHGCTWMKPIILFAYGIQCIAENYRDFVDVEAVLLHRCRPSLLTPDQDFGDDVGGRIRDFDQRTLETLEAWSAPEVNVPVLLKGHGQVTQGLRVEAFLDFNRSTRLIRHRKP